MLNASILWLLYPLLAAVVALALSFLIYRGARSYSRILLNRLRKNDAYFNKLYDFVVNNLKCPVEPSIFTSSRFQHFRIFGLIPEFGIVLERKHLVNKKGVGVAILAHEAGHFLRYASFLGGQLEFISCPFAKDKNIRLGQCYLDEEISAWIYAFQILNKVFGGNFDKREFANCAAGTLFSYFATDDYFNKGVCPFESDAIIKLAALENLIFGELPEKAVLTERMKTLSELLKNIVEIYDAEKNFFNSFALKIWFRVKTKQLVNYNPPFHIFKPR